jgi:hypothetical protein
MDPRACEIAPERASVYSNDGGEDSNLPQTCIHGLTGATALMCGSQLPSGNWHAADIVA